ncbi:trypsin-like peptidase [Pseudaminobacter salicylatoxidans]|uniref:Trypsin-like peptidase n=1 Tax=Pseudaminobacter salicylatoxidans TaxID=93369 RepID=A0A316C0K9_PSESE|nr:serine protease [Pseudaminobacter salicylatoxidans]PWJ79784.1 trypsin-like peptidase [Pseudaminobacter salicylatoxidans]
MPLTPAEKMLYSATRITTYHRGMRRSVGTGFFYIVNLENGRSSALLVTNRHVFEGCDRIDVTLPIRDENGEPSRTFHTWQLEFQGNPIGHPDPTIDLAVISITDLHRQTAGAKELPFYITLSRDIIPSVEAWAEFDAIEEVTMVGCPNGLFDEANNLPIIRRGITATHPAKNYQGRDEFMVDLACFPGSSGSPVFLYSTGANFDRATGGYALGNIRLLLMGILYAGPTINQRGEIVLARQPAVSVAAMMHLGTVIKSTHLLAFDALVQEHVEQGTASLVE